MSLPAFLAVESEPFSPEDLDLALEPSRDPDDTLWERSPAIARWTIEDEGAAQWAMALYAEALAEVFRISAQADEWAERIADWQESESRRAGQRLAFFRVLIEDYARRRREEDPRHKTLRLPSGEVKSRSVAARVVVVDSDVALNWLRQNAPETIKVVQSVSMSELRKATRITDDGVVCPETGELVPGVEVEPDHVSFSVTVAK
jgi:hypothetical protein